MPKTDIVKLLKEGQTIQIHPQGNSMLPFIYPGRDEVVISPDTSELRKHDIVLYRSKETGYLTLHRIIRVENDTIYVCGDNQTRLEPIGNEQIIGIVIEIIRNGKHINTDSIAYRTAAALYVNNKQTISKLRALVKR